MYTAFENYARRVVTHLGDGWTAARHSTWTDCLITSHTDGRTLELWSQNDGARLGANGHFPSTEYNFLVGDRPETYAAITRRHRRSLDRSPPRGGPATGGRWAAPPSRNSPAPARRRRAPPGTTSLTPCGRLPNGMPPSGPS